MEAASAEIDIAERFAEEFATAFAELGEQNENGDLDPAEVIRQASKIALQRMGRTVETDRSSLDDETAEQADYSGTGADPIVNRMDRALMTKLHRADRVSVGGVDALLKSEIEFRKMDDGRGGHDLAKIIREPNELAERLNARAGMRKSMELSVADSAPRGQASGSFSPGVLDLPPDATIYTRADSQAFAKRIIALHARSEAGDISKLLH